MERQQTFEKLMQLPLFQGMSNDDLTQLVGHTKLDFRKAEERTVIVKEDTPCRELLFILDGDVLVESRGANSHYIITETAHGPLAIQPERLFGLHQRYSRSFTTCSTCHLLSISKQEVLRLLAEQMIFRFNLLNITAAQAHRYERTLWQVPPANLPQRIIRFIMARCLRPAGEKHIKIKMTTLAEEMGCSRLEVSNALHQLQDRALLNISRNFIHIPHIEQTLNLFSSTQQQK